ncbi:MAG: hypothetical protein ABSC17_08565 [Thermacetogeniaceae bacterium]
MEPVDIEKELLAYESAQDVPVPQAADETEEITSGPEETTCRYAGAAKQQGSDPSFIANCCVPDLVIDYYKRFGYDEETIQRLYLGAIKKCGSCTQPVKTTGPGVSTKPGCGCGR